MAQRYTVREGDCLSSIAYDAGHLPDTIWMHGDNQELRDLRKDRNVLMSGDVLAIPDLNTEPKSASSNQKHQFRRKAVPGVLRLRFERNGRPRAGVAYTIDIDGDVREGTLDDNGGLEEPILPNAKEAIVSFPDTDETFKTKLGRLDPVTTESGQSARLKSLAFFDPSSDSLSAAIARFQVAKGLEASGVCDAATQQSLVDAYGS